MRAHRREIPSQKKIGKREVLYLSTFLFTAPEANIMLLSYKVKKLKLVYIFPSSLKSTTINKDKKKAQAILDYNANKKGVDTADEMLRTYSTKVASRSWPLVTFFNLLNITALITFIIYANISISICTRHTFIIKLGKSLCSAEKSRRQKTPHLLRLK